MPRESKLPVRQQLLAITQLGRVDKQKYVEYLLDWEWSNLYQYDM